MSKKIASLALLSFCLCILSCGRQAPPDLILFNGKIFTSDSTQPYVQALAIRGERVLATGDSRKIQALAAARTKRIDLGGRTVIPGINDAHNHVADAVTPPNEVNLPFKTQDPTWDEVREALSEKIPNTPKGTLIEVQIGPRIFHDLAVNRDSLDKIGSGHPVALATFTGHAYIMNSAALASIGIREDQKDPVAGGTNGSRMAGLTASSANMRRSGWIAVSSALRAKRTR